MQNTDQQNAEASNFKRYIPWFLAAAFLGVFLVQGMYAAAIGGALGIGIVWAGAKGLMPEQGPSKTGNAIAIILVFAIVLVFAFAWWVGRGA